MLPRLTAAKTRLLEVAVIAAIEEPVDAAPIEALECAVLFLGARMRTGSCFGAVMSGVSAEPCETLLMRAIAEKG